MNNLLKEKGIIKKVDWSNPDEVEKINKENNEILRQYMPYSSDYNSMVLWSINGLVPDDMNNTFSDKKCAIVDGLKEQVEQSNVISLVPTDTAIKGNVSLSAGATILVSKEAYDSLSQEKKDELEKLNLNVDVFEGSLKDAVDGVLQRDGRYTAETLSLYRKDDGYEKSDTSDEVRETVCDIAKERGIAQVLHWNVITGQNDEKDKLVDVEKEFKNSLIVKEFYKTSFFEYLFDNMDIDNRVKGDAMFSPESPVYMEALCKEIDRLGLDKYKALVDKYNKSLEQLRECGKLPTPQQIVNSHRNKEKISLISMMKERDSESTLLESAIEGTEKTVTTSQIQSEDKILEKAEKEINEKSKELEVK